MRGSWKEEDGDPPEAEETIGRRGSADLENGYSANTSVRVILYTSDARLQTRSFWVPGVLSALFVDYNRFLTFFVGRDSTTTPEEEPT